MKREHSQGGVQHRQQLSHWGVDQLSLAGHEPTITRQPALAPSPQPRPAPMGRTLIARNAKRGGPFWMLIWGPDECRSTGRPRAVPRHSYDGPSRRPSAAVAVRDFSELTSSWPAPQQFPPSPARRADHQRSTTTASRDAVATGHHSIFILHIRNMKPFDINEPNPHSPDNFGRHIGAAKPPGNYRSNRRRTRQSGCPAGSGPGHRTFVRLLSPLRPVVYA